MNRIERGYHECQNLWVNGVPISFLLALWVL